MNFNVMPSLEHIALLKVTSTLWNQYDVEEVERKFCYPLTKLSKERNWQKWIKVEDKVIEKVAKLSLPESLKNKILCFMRPLGLRIGTWLDFRNREICFVSKLSTDIHWTCRGTIDTKRMAESLVKDESLGIKERFEVACTFCLEEHIVSLWPSLPKNSYNSSNMAKTKCSFLISYWLYALRGKLDNFALHVASALFDSVHENACWRSTIDSNEMAARYFFQKLTPIERERSLSKIGICAVINRCYNQKTKFFPDAYCTDILSFFLSTMNEEQYKMLFNGIPNPFSMLGYFFDWPWQDFFPQVLQCVSTAYNFYDFSYLLMQIEEKITYGFKDYNYKKFFRVFWPRIPHFAKVTIINMFIKEDYHSLFELFKTKDEENIKMFLREATVVVEKENIFHGKGRRICEILMCFELWDLLKFFIQEFALTKNMLLKLKEQIEKGIVYTRGREKQKCMLEQFLKIIDEWFQNCGKRASEEASHPTKRVCSGMLEESNVQI